MVFFTCNACGESMKKNQVEKHYKFQCKNCDSLSCVDCSKVFWGDEYTKHIKCITEDAKYGGKDYKPKPNANKGERKQEEWVEQVQSAVDKCKSNVKLKQLLEKLMDYSNIPRKKPKFENFVKNSLRIPAGLATQMWDAISVELQASKAVTTANKSSDDSDNNKQSNGVVHTNTEEEKEKSEDTKKLSKRERKEERRKKMNKNEKKNKKLNEENNENVQQKKKSKKRKREEVEENDEEQNEAVENAENSSKKKKKKKNREEEKLPSPTKKLKTQDSNLDESTQQCDEEKITKQKFNWEDIITTLLKKADNRQLSIKRLRKKVIAEYYAVNADNPHTEEKILAKFNKKINNKTLFKVHKEKVTLKS